MLKNSKKYLKFILLTALALPVMPQTIQAAVDPEAELEPFELYFDESQLVEVASRAPKPISQIAENVTVVTAEEIERMHVHSLAGVLEQVPSVFIDATNGGKDFSTPGTLSIQGSEFQQVLVLLDGVVLNMPASGIIYTNIVPLPIIKRIEIIKGAASSTWGSALGGVINIVTKDTGTALRPAGNLATSFGEYGSQDSSADGAGALGKLQYYLFAGDQYSDGIRDDKYFDQTSLYGKLHLPVSRFLNITLTSGYSDMDEKFFHFEPLQFYQRDRHRLFFNTLGLDGSLTDTLSYHLSLQRLEDEFGYNGDFFAFPWSNSYDMQTDFANLRLIWQPENHTVVLGAESSRAEEIDSTDFSALGPGIPYTAPAIYEETRALYLNDTWRLGNWSIIPGVRYDYSSVFEEKVDPSLGVTYRWSQDTLLRAQAGRGFRRPPLNIQRGDSTFYWWPQPPNLAPENVWTYQGGIESTALSFLRLKGTLFYHRSTDVWDAGVTMNGGIFIRKGLELEAETASWRGFSLAANYSFIHEHPDNEVNGRQWAAKLIAKYDDGDGLSARLFGNYVWWGAYYSDRYLNGLYSDMLWDFSIDKRICQTERTDTTVFFAAHNLFSGDNSLDEYEGQTERWVEAGLRFSFR